MKNCLRETSFYKISAWLAIISLGGYLGVSNQLAYGQTSSDDDSTSYESLIPERHPAVMKFAVVWLIPGLFFNELHLGVQYEKALVSNPNFTFTNGLLFRKSSTGVSSNGVRLFTSQHTVFIIRPGMRYYIRKSPEVYRGFFVSVAPFYTYGEYYDKTEYRHGVGLDGMIGYQRVFNRWTVEANYSVGVARTWYDIVEDPWGGPRQGIKNYVFPEAQINIGYLFW